jgi:hypothetical protein
VRLKPRSKRRPSASDQLLPATPLQAVSTSRRRDRHRTAMTRSVSVASTSHCAVTSPLRISAPHYSPVVRSTSDCHRPQTGESSRLSMEAQLILLRISFLHSLGFGLCLDRLSIRPRGPRSRRTMFSDHALALIAFCTGVPVGTSVIRDVPAPAPRARSAAIRSGLMGHYWTASTSISTCRVSPTNWRTGLGLQI